MASANPRPLPQSHEAHRCRRRARARDHGQGRQARRGLRIGVKNGGCAGMEYTMEWAEDQKPFDEVVEDKGVKVLVDPKAMMFLLGTEMDYPEHRR